MSKISQLQSIREYLLVKISAIHLGKQIWLRRKSDEADLYARIKLDLLEDILAYVDSFVVDEEAKT